jgi:hypothetical protein
MVPVSCSLVAVMSLRLQDAGRDWRKSGLRWLDMARQFGAGLKGTTSCGTIAKHLSSKISMEVYTQTLFMTQTTTTILAVNGKIITPNCIDDDSAAIDSKETVRTKAKFQVIPEDHGMKFGVECQHGQSNKLPLYIYG